MHRFTISICETVLEQWPNLMEGRGTKELEQLKSLSLKIQEETMSKNVVITEKKGKQYVR